jgi:outer membrane protein OmpA-like peptidoglycan-associated protein
VTIFVPQRRRLGVQAPGHPERLDNRGDETARDERHTSKLGLRFVLPLLAANARIEAYGGCVIAGFQSKMVWLCVWLSFIASVAACRKHEPDKEETAPTFADQTALRQSLEGLKPVLESQDARFASLRKQVESLPADLPGFADVRAKFYATEEGRGIMGAKLGWLSQRLASAAQAKNGAELQKVKRDIQKTRDELREIDKLSVVFVHQLAQLQRMSGLQREESSAAAPFSRVLPTGYDVKGERDGLEQHLLQLVEDPSQKMDRNTWFDFDRVSFGDGSAELDAGRTRAQIENVAEILKAYPRVKLRLAEFGAPAAKTSGSTKRSAARVHAVKAELARLGVAASRLDAQEFGAEHPCPSKDPEACKGEHPRVWVQVTAK